MECTLASSMNRGKKVLQTSNRVQTLVTDQAELSSHTYLVDGSWVGDWNGGLWYIIKGIDKLIKYTATPILALSPLHVEAWALKEAWQEVINEGIRECVFYSDCLELVQALVQLRVPIDMDWKAFKEVFELWKIYRNNKEFRCIHVSRDLNEEADKLARLGRLTGN